jgi:hypothetical protein
MARRKDEDPWNYAVVHDKTAAADVSAVTGHTEASSCPSEQMVQLYLLDDECGSFRW